MDTEEINIFFLLAYIFVAVLIVGVIVFIFQARKRKLLHEREKNILEEQHQFNMVMRQFEIQQQTMQDIGQEIHDNVGQQLTLASLYTRQLQMMEASGEKLERLDKISVIINESLADLRSLSKTLTDNSVQQALLYDLVERECKKVNELGVCEVLFRSDIQHMAAGYRAKAIIVRLVQEFLQNSLKHARCTHIWVALHLVDGNMVLEMRDDGIGFETDTEHPAGIGLESMKKRALLLDAEFTLTSNTRAGTQLRVVIPGTKLLY